MINRALKQGAEMGSLHGSITDGNGNVAGFLGEEIILAECSDIKRENTYDYDMLLNDMTIDVKTKRCTSKPRDYYECSIADFNTKQKSDIYIFVRVMNDYSKGWILGYKKKNAYFKDAVFHEKGDVDTNNDFVFKADCYNLAIKDLDKIEDIM